MFDIAEKYHAAFIAAAEEFRDAIEKATALRDDICDKANYMHNETIVKAREKFLLDVTEMHTTFELEAEHKLAQFRGISPSNGSTEAAQEAETERERAEEEAQLEQETLEREQEAPSIELRAEDRV